MNSLLLDQLNMYENNRLREEILKLKAEIDLKYRDINKITIELNRRQRNADHIRNMNQTAKDLFSQYIICFYEELALETWQGIMGNPLLYYTKYWIPITTHNSMAYQMKRFNACHNWGYRFDDETFIFVCDTCGSMSDDYKELEKEHGIKY